MGSFTPRGSQRWLQIAVNRRPQLLTGALQRSGAIGARTLVKWTSPLEKEEFQEYRDCKALEKAGVTPASLRIPLEQFWPARGPVWDALGSTADRHPVFIEAKAHIPEAATPQTKASEASRRLIDESLGKARAWYAPRATTVWSNLFYQYANRLAYQYFLRQLNSVQSSLVSLYFVNADDMLGPMSEDEWRGAVRLIHAVLGVPKDLTRFGVFDAFLDVRLLQDAVSN